ncbi:hypothetical protein AYO22_10389 [Fonsecaea multimorphosa]|nr:hypothetical protein AYO22_10389 [Fonsecaea multimorphosa]
MDLSQHVQILQHCDGGDGGAAGIQSVESALRAILDSRGPSSIPAWKITVVPFSQQSCFVGFSFAHSIGDGLSGLIFHRTFLEALQDPIVEEDLIWAPKLRQLDPPFDTPTNLPISWSFLLRPLLGSMLPARIASLIGVGEKESSHTSWTASKTFYNPETHLTGLKTLSIDGPVVQEALKTCRKHRGKLTGLLHQLIINALSESLAQYEGGRDTTLDTLVTRTALNMRGCVDKSNEDDMGNFVTATTRNHAIKKVSGSNPCFEIDWASVRSDSAQLAAAAKELRDQPLGLLRYVSDVRGWVLSQLGRRRDCSYEISNLLAFQPSGPGRPTKRSAAVTEMVFCQPADALGPLLYFNVVSVADGPLTLTVTWQTGALALDSGHEEEEEAAFVEMVCRSIESGFTRVSGSPP